MNNDTLVTLIVIVVIAFTAMGLSYRNSLVSERLYLMCIEANKELLEKLPKTTLTHYCRY